MTGVTCENVGMKFAVVLVILSAVMPGQSKLTAVNLLTAADAKEFAGGAEFTREDGAMGSPNIVSVRVQPGDEYSHYLMIYLEPLPAEIKSYPNYVKDRVEQSAAVDNDEEKKFDCSVPGAAASGCKEIKSPFGSFRENQRVAKVVFGKGRNFIRIEMFRDYKADFPAALKLAQKILARLP